MNMGMHILTVPYFRKFTIVYDRIHSIISDPPYRKETRYSDICMLFAWRLYLVLNSLRIVVNEYLYFTTMLLAVYILQVCFVYETSEHCIVLSLYVCIDYVVNRLTIYNARVSITYWMWKSFLFSKLQFSNFIKESSAKQKFCTVYSGVQIVDLPFSRILHNLLFLCRVAWSATKENDQLQQLHSAIHCNDLLHLTLSLRKSWYITPYRKLSFDFSTWAVAGCFTSMIVFAEILI
jgi:hypothetical protein